MKFVNFEELYFGWEKMEITVDVLFFGVFFGVLGFFGFCFLLDFF